MGGGGQLTLIHWGCYVASLRIIYIQGSTVTQFTQYTIQTHFHTHVVYIFYLHMLQYIQSTRQI